MSLSLILEVTFSGIQVGSGVSHKRGFLFITAVVLFSKPLCGLSFFSLLQKTNQSAYLKIQREKRRLFLQIEILRPTVTF